RPQPPQATAPRSQAVNWARERLRLAVYAGESLSGLTSIAAAQSGTNGTGAELTLTFSAQTGMTYKIALDAANIADTDVGDFIFTLQLRPGNDDYANRIFLTGT